MVSTMEKDFNLVNGKYVFGFKIYPDWYGIPNVGFVYHNDWSNPEIEYNGKRINATIVEDTMWERFKEEREEQGKTANVNYFGNYMKEHSEDVYELIELAME